jgi:hypothetical protein
MDDLEWRDEVNHAAPHPSYSQGLHSYSAGNQHTFVGLMWN